MKEGKKALSSVIESCRPRADILAGSFNPEVFTAALGPVIQYYRTGTHGLDDVYLNAEAFFHDATFPTTGLKQILDEVFARIHGSNDVPAIHRLETAFGGGKTHTLIACAHVAFRGRDLAGVLGEFINDLSVLPEPGVVNVVGVAGDEIPVHQPKGQSLVPYTLWGEIAYQMGGESLYRNVEVEAGSYAAPGKTYFDAVFGGRKALIMLDELAQYAARLEAARPDGASQLAAFLLGLHGYARSHSGMAIILTLASAADAFGRQTAQLAKLVGQVRGEVVSEDYAIGLGERAVSGVSSVVARDAVQVTPVQAREISSVFAKRLFESVDTRVAEQTAEEYLMMYRKNTGLLPEETVHDSFRGRMVATYPFHPTLVDFLNQKLASAENFQGTRGILRVLSLAVRTLWQKQQHTPMIHASHLDLRSDRVVNEVLGRTGSSDLLFVITADIGGVNTDSLQDGASNAELEDRKNPHPEGYPLYEWTWKTVFLHSLVARDEALGSRVFGISEQDAIFSVALPSLTPPQVRVALDAIQERAFYLRFEQGRYFASTEPTINSVLAKIRRTVKGSEIEALLQDTVRKTIGSHAAGQLFSVQHDVLHPEDVPDGKGKPTIAVVSLLAEAEGEGQLDVESIMTTVGQYKPRVEQNLVFLLVSDAVTVHLPNHQPSLVNTRADETRQSLDMIARQVIAIRKLNSKPMDYGVNPKHLDDAEFRKRRSERENALQTAVAGVYTRLYYASGAQIELKELRSASGESGAAILQQIRELLIREGKLVPSGMPTKEQLLGLGALFFAQGDVVMLKTIRTNFLSMRRWPVLEEAKLLEQVVRLGVEQELWCLYAIEEGETGVPTEFYYKENPVPMSFEWGKHNDGLVTVPGARQRGWWPSDSVDVQPIVAKVVRDARAIRLSEVVQAGKTLQPADDDAYLNAVSQLIRERRFMAYEGTPDQHQKPAKMYDATSVFYTPQVSHVLITREEANNRGWFVEKPRSHTYEGRDVLTKLWNLLPRIGSYYARGATTKIDVLELVDLALPDGGEVTLSFHDLTPNALKNMDETFQVLSRITTVGSNSDVYLNIVNMDDNCVFAKELQKLMS